MSQPSEVRLGSAAGRDRLLKTIIQLHYRHSGAVAALAMIVG